VTPPLIPALSQEMETAARALDLHLDAALSDEVPLATRHVGLGRAHRVLADRAATMGADLLVLGPHRYRGPGLGVRGLGTTTDRLVRTAEVPCWIARGELPLPLGRLMVATDLSDLSRPALDLALHLAAGLGGAADAVGAPPPEVDVVHVEWPAALRHDPDREARVLLPNLADEITLAGRRTGLGGKVLTHPRVCAAVDPSRGILAHGAEHGLPVTVLGTHGRGALARALLGSVAAIVAREAPGHVVLVPPGEANDG
jgi:nucleotide-binding universal stress UspA family protein